MHPAALNFGDCFAYEFAKAHNCPLLFVGEDFAKQTSRAFFKAPRPGSSTSCRVVYDISSKPPGTIEREQRPGGFHLTAFPDETRNPTLHRLT